MSQSLDAVGLAMLAALVLAFGVPGAAVGWALPHLAVLALYSLAVPRRPGRPGFAELARIAWRGCGYGATIAGFFGLVLLGLIGGGAKAGVEWLGQWLGDLLSALIETLGGWLHDFYSRLQTIPGGPFPVLLAVLGLAAVSLLHPGARRRLGRIVHGLAGFAGAAGCLAMTLAFVVFGEPLVDGGVDGAQWLWVHIPGRQYIRPAVLLVVLVLIARAGLIRLLEWIHRLRSSEPPASSSWTPEAWKAKLDAAPPSEQESLLRFEPQSLGLSARAFLRLFKEVYPSVKEPAQNAYWRRLEEIEQAARQEHFGSEPVDPTLDPS